MNRTFLRCILPGILAISMSVLNGCATDKQVIAQAADVHGTLKPAVMTDPELSKYIQTVGDRIVNAAREMYQSGYRPKKKVTEDSSWMFSKGMQFHFVASDTLNAFTTGGEHMYIYSKLFEDCKSEDELAAVMAHEYGHVFGRHVQQSMNRQYAMMGAAAAAGAAGYALSKEDNRLANAGTFAGGALVAGQFLGMGYTRDDEREADSLGYDFYVHAGWDPAKFADFFKSMIAKGYDKTPQVMSDHPTLASRVTAAEERSVKLPANAAMMRKPPVADASRFRQLQAKATRIAKTMPQDDTTKGAKLMLASFPSCVTPEDQPDQKQAQQRLHAILQSMKSR